MRDKMNLDVGSARKLSRMKRGQKFIFQENMPTDKPLNFEESSKKRWVHVDTQKNNMNIKASICSQNIKSNTPNKELIILSWNVSSIKQDTLSEAKQTGAHILCLQETRREIGNSTSYTFYNKLRKHNPNRGGGITVGIHKQFFSKNISNLLPKIQELLECLLIHVTGKQLELFIFNIYSPKEQYYKKSKKALENFILQLMQSKRKALFILCGDINYPINQLSFMKDIIPLQQHTFQRLIDQNEVKSKTDCIMVNQNVQASIKSYESSQSDHLILVGIIQLQQSYLSTKQYQIYLIKQNIFLLNAQANQNQPFQLYYQELKQKMNEIQCFQRTAQTLKKISRSYKQPIKNILQNIEQQIRSNEAEKAFKSINRLLIMNPTKRDGGIMNCFMDGESLISCNKQILKNCLQQLAIFSKIQTYSPLLLPKLKPISFKEFQFMKQRMSQHKGLTFDLISDKWIKQMGTYEILSDLWSQETADLILNFGENRLIPLNKAYPNIPEKDQFRPIIVQSPIMKW